MRRLVEGGASTEPRGPGLVRRGGELELGRASRLAPGKRQQASAFQGLRLAGSERGRGGLVGRGPSGRSAGWLEGAGSDEGWWGRDGEWCRGVRLCGGARMERTRRTRQALQSRPPRASAPTEPIGRTIQTPIGRTSVRSGSVQQKCIRSEGGSRATLKTSLAPASSPDTRASRLPKLKTA
jgi:hypothetical protein